MKHFPFEKDSELNGFEKLTIHQPDDFEGSVVCTLIRKTAENRPKDVMLHVHGFNDYFFHDHLAKLCFENQIDLYALDLRKSGRSIRPHHKMNNLRNIQEYYDDITAALNIIGELHDGKIILSGHSMGGLITALFTAKYQKDKPISGLFLNSPFLEQNKDILTRKLLIPLVASLGKHKPNLLVPGGFSKFYGPSLHRNFYGRWQYNLQWKPHVADLVNAGWVRAIYKAQQALRAGLYLQMPVLVAYPEKSYAGFFWNAKFMQADAVVNVKHIEKYQQHIFSPAKQTVVIPNAVHDLFLSSPEVVEKTFTILLRWVQRIQSENQPEKHSGHDEF